MGKSEVQKSIERGDRLRDLGSDAEKYRAFRDILQKAVFDDKNYNIDIIELAKALGYRQ